MRTQATRDDDLMRRVCGLTLDLSGGTRAQPLARPLEGLVRRRWDRLDTHGGDDATELAGAYD
jgi:hypothetical protein